MGNLALFNFSGNKVRVAIDERNGEPFWVAKDVCDVLGYKNSRDAISKLDADEKGVSEIATPSGNQKMSVINESGLYTLILRSNKPEAKRFKKWVTSEVLPSIRKTGAYALKKEMRFKMMGYKSQLAQKNKKIALLEAKVALFGECERVKETARHLLDEVRKLENENLALREENANVKRTLIHIKDRYHEIVQKADNQIEALRKELEVMTSHFQSIKNLACNGKNLNTDTKSKHLYWETKKRSTPALL